MHSSIRESTPPPLRTRRGLFRGGTYLAALLLLTGLLANDAQTSNAAPDSLEPFRLLEASITDMQNAMASGVVTSRDLVEMYLARIEAYDEQGPALNAIISLNPNALAEAEALDRERATSGPRGPLHGIPVLIKDNYDTHDMPTTNASLALEGSIPPDDAYQVRRLREAGAVIIAKTNLHEFARGITSVSSLGGQTLNPYDPGRNPGGSSGGTGAAVAANFGAFGMGSDTCGSIRIPASHNALVGLRPSMGLSSRDGIIPLSLTQDVGGPLARSVRDLALVFDATVGYDPADPVTALGVGRIPETYTAFLRPDALQGARIGILTDLFGTDPADEEVNAVVRASAQEMAAAGAQLVEVSIPGLVDDLAASGVIPEDFKFDLEAYLAQTPGAPFKTLQAIMDSGLFHPSLIPGFETSLAVESRDTVEYLRKLKLQRDIKQATLAAMADHGVDVLLYPTINRKAAPIGEPQPGSNCRLSAHTGLPAMSIPGGFTADGLPVGVELLGREFGEPTLFGLAYAYEQATHHRRPPASTPELEPEWTYRVSGDGGTLLVDTIGRRLRVTGDGVDSGIVNDPSMESNGETVRGDVTSGNFRLVYTLRAESGGQATARLTNLATGTTFILRGQVE